MQHKITPTAYFFTSIKFVFSHARHILMLCIIPVVLHFLIILVEYFIFDIEPVVSVIVIVNINAIFTGVYLLYAVQSMHTDKTFNFKNSIKVLFSSKVEGAEKVYKVAIRSLFLGLISLLFIVIVSATLTSNTILSVVMILTFILIFGRLYLSIPAIACGDIAKLSHIWYISKGLSFKILILAFWNIVLIALWLIAVAVYFIVTIENDIAIIILDIIFFFIAYFLYAIIIHSYLLLYLGIKNRHKHMTQNMLYPTAD